MHKYLKTQGFTLVELLVVISIIALIMGIMTPVINKTRNVALRTVCKSNLRSIGIGFRSYLDDNDNTMPPAARMPSLKLNDKYPITKYLKTCVPDDKAFLCPGDTGKKFFLAETSSYEYNSSLGEKPVSKSWLVEIRDEKESNIQIIIIQVN